MSNLPQLRFLTALASAHGLTLDLFATLFPATFDLAARSWRQANP